MIFILLLEMWHEYQENCDIVESNKIVRETNSLYYREGNKCVYSDTIENDWNEMEV